MPSYVDITCFECSELVPLIDADAEGFTAPPVIVNTSSCSAARASRSARLRRHARSISTAERGTSPPELRQPDPVFRRHPAGANDPAQTRSPNRGLTGQPPRKGRPDWRRFPSASGSQPGRWSRRRLGRGGALSRDRPFLAEQKDARALLRLSSSGRARPRRRHCWSHEALAVLSGAPGGVGGFCFGPGSHEAGLEALPPHGRQTGGLPRASVSARSRHEVAACGMCDARGEQLGRRLGWLESLAPRRGRFFRFGRGRRRDGAAAFELASFGSWLAHRYSMSCTV